MTIVPNSILSILQIFLVWLENLSPLCSGRPSPNQQSSWNCKQADLICSPKAYGQLKGKLYWRTTGSTLIISDNLENLYWKIPFHLVYGTKSIILIEVGAISLKICHFDWYQEGKSPDLFLIYELRGIL